MHLLGIGYTENYFKASILFEKNKGSYQLKYFSKETGDIANIERALSLLKKKERFTFDKTLQEISTDIKVRVNNKESVEVLVLDQKEISHTQFVNFKQKERMPVIYVDQFSDKLWQGFSTIEPTKQMREYKKQN